MAAGIPREACEVAYAQTIMGRLLNGFTNNQGDNQADPHGYDDKRVLNALEERLGLKSVAELTAVPLDHLHEAAITSLNVDSAFQG